MCSWQDFTPYQGISTTFGLNHLVTKYFARETEARDALTPETKK